MDEEAGEVGVTKQKRTGAHFTPPALAAVVAERLSEVVRTTRGPLRILDPACGDGNLLLAISTALPRQTLARCTLIGIEQDPDSFSAVQTRLASTAGCRTELIAADFLELFDDRPLFGPSCAVEPVDVIIANPPYVRTQVLGAARAQRLAATFQLSGRVDLYQAFLVAMTRALKPGGRLGVITSNRFLTIKGGTATRRLLASQFDLQELVDLGDTKLFEAAVLPALVFARKRCGETVADASATRFLRVYEDPSGTAAAKPAASVYDLLRAAKAGYYSVNGTRYRVSTGSLKLSNDAAVPWVMQTDEERDWVGQVNASASCRIRDVASIRVGIKTTADRVFIQRDWEAIGAAWRPEACYLRPLLSHEEAARWLPADSGKRKRVLYTHEVENGRRRAIAFPRDSSAWKYLESHRGELESRTYVLEAGRRWYEIWVPQDPEAWRRPKIVFPDISTSARFFLDRSGAIVDGNCYWITTNDAADEELLLLVLGVANSSLIGKYHELCFQNQLYSQRRRYLTQYVQEYPLPDRRLPECHKIVQLARRLTDSDTTAAQRETLERQVNQLVEEAFGLPPGEGVSSGD